MRYAAVLRRSADRVPGVASAPLTVRDALAPLLRSKLLRTLCGYVLLLTGTATLLYVEQARMVAQSSSDDGERTLLFGVERPGREALLTALDRDQKYAPKAFIDSVVYRGGDALAAWLSQALPASALAPAALALCAVWLMNSLALARIGEQRKGRLR